MGAQAACGSKHICLALLRLQAPNRSAAMPRELMGKADNWCAVGNAGQSALAGAGVVGGLLVTGATAIGETVVKGGKDYSVTKQAVRGVDAAAEDTAHYWSSMGSKSTCKVSCKVNKDGPEVGCEFGD